jgi:hypothetical protein
MEEILNKLLESEFLNEESKAAISEQWKAAVEVFKEEKALEIRAELAEQWTNEKNALFEKVDSTVEKLLASEVAELHEDIERFRDLEAESAGQLAEEKQRLAVTLGEELDGLVDKIDAFLEYRLNEEMSELKDDIEVVKENEFGRRMYEAFKVEFNSTFVNEDSLQSQIAQLQDQLSDAEERLTEAEEEKKRVDRSKKLDEVLAPLSGIKREQMSIILSAVDTHKLQESYNMYIARVLKESTEEKTEKALTEAAVEEKVATKVVTGEELVEEVKKPISEEAESELQKTLRLAGVIR